MRCLFCLALIVLTLPAFAVERSNVTFIIADDHGYGDVGAHGKPPELADVVLSIGCQ